MDKTKAAIEYLIQHEIIPLTDDYIKAMEESILMGKVMDFYPYELRTECNGDSVACAMQKYSRVAGWDLDSYKDWPRVKARLEKVLEEL